MENYIKEDRYFEAKKQVDKMKGFYIHLITYIIVNISLLYLFYIANDSKSEFWSLSSFSTLLFWGIGLLIHALSVFGPTITYFKDWETRKLAQFMKEEETQKHQ